MDEQPDKPAQEAAAPERAREPPRASPKHRWEGWSNATWIGAIASLLTALVACGALIVDVVRGDDAPSSQVVTTTTEPPTTTGEPLPPLERQTVRSREELAELLREHASALPATAEPYTFEDAATDESTLSMQVPEQWQTAVVPWDGAAGSEQPRLIGAAIMSSIEPSRVETTYDSPGVFVGASNQVSWLPGEPPPYHDSGLDQGCVAVARGRFNGTLEHGDYVIYSRCGPTGALAIELTLKRDAFVASSLSTSATREDLHVSFEARNLVDQRDVDAVEEMLESLDAISPVETPEG